MGIKKVLLPGENCYQCKKQSADLLKELVPMTCTPRILYCAVYNILRLISGDFCRFYVILYFAAYSESYPGAPQY